MAGANCDFAQQTFSPALWTIRLRAHWRAVAPATPRACTAGRHTAAGDRRPPGKLAIYRLAHDVMHPSPRGGNASIDVPGKMYILCISFWEHRHARWIYRKSQQGCSLGQ
jgi:hypothetical protein